jgi:hypothetical protein
MVELRLSTGQSRSAALPATFSIVRFAHVHSYVSGTISTGDVVSVRTWGRILPYGEVKLNMATRLDLSDPTPPGLDEETS